jgi:hypothetical protein
MLSEKEQASYLGLVKRYRMIAKLTFVPMSIPVIRLLYYCTIGRSIAVADQDNIIWDIALFIVVWTAFMSFHTKADVISAILEAAKSEDAAQSK